ncbi:ATP-binding protein [Acidithiobacillus sp. VAN18-1]|uniref:ATP-binding protein n=1 Tax=Igneacidithiobacillus copahuensis TaxID=2724909 RepID=A0AAE3CKL4_9PROT|nr:ATP-binding protein [Igneacidithiobacillus copahuensis]MBU2788615.1 ATP-binding protein [Igneacidithiobacillus copahuensis]MBU2796701.1 ATP-binding protein [Acidithiobacillus sp. VAN18-2]
MGLLNLQEGGQMEPVRMILYGKNGIGKTTFGAGMPQPFILAVEDGIGPMPVMYDRAHHKTYDQIVGTLMEVGGYFQSGRFRSLVVDSMDALQVKVFDKILSEHGKKHIGDFSYGKGYELFKQEWESFKDLMERFRVELGANVLLIAQCDSRTIADPINGDHNSNTMRLDKRASGVLRDWADLVGFAQLESNPIRNKDGEIVRLQETGRRILRTSPSEAFDAKNRFNLPPTLPLAWVAVEQAIKEAYARPFDPNQYAQVQSGFGQASPAGLPQPGMPPAGFGQPAQAQPNAGFAPSGKPASLAAPAAPMQPASPVQPVQTGGFPKPPGF